MCPFIPAERQKAGIISSGIKSADALIKSGEAVVYQVSISDTAALAIELNDSLDNSGTDIWGVDLPVGSYAHFLFDPPISFKKGIYLDVSTATCKVSIFYL